MGTHLRSGEASHRPEVIGIAGVGLLATGMFCCLCTGVLDIGALVVASVLKCSLRAQHADVRFHAVMRTSCPLASDPRVYWQRCGRKNTTTMGCSMCCSASF